MKIKEYDYAPIGARIKKVRQDRRLTQEMFAEKINVSCQFVSDMERGLSGVSLSTLMEICKVLDIDADYILFGTVTRDERNPINKLLMKMTPQQAQCAEEMLAAFARGVGV